MVDYNIRTLFSEIIADVDDQLAKALDLFDLKKTEVVIHSEQGTYRLDLEPT